MALRTQLTLQIRFESNHVVEEDHVLRDSYSMFETFSYFIGLTLNYIST